MPSDDDTTNDNDKQIMFASSGTVQWRKIITENFDGDELTNNDAADESIHLSSNGNVNVCGTSNCDVLV